MTDPLSTATLMLMLLNPFLVIIYLVDVVDKLSLRRFAITLSRSALIAGVVFCFFAIMGERVFTRIVQAEFGSFQIFGGVIFLLIGLQFVFKGPGAVAILRGDSAGLAGAIAMPVLIGPGTLSASILAGKRHDPLLACIIVVGAVVTCVLIMILLKALHDWVRPRNEPLVQNYIEVTGRITALFIGTISVEMIMRGAADWSERF
jgi:small neutral amino acid transporter SnatA (MarC family)